MRSDYLLYALAVVFFIITAASLLFVMSQTEQSLWVLSTVVLGLFSAGLGYHYRPKVKATAVSSVSVPAAQTADTGNAHAKEAHLAESVETHVEEPTATPPTVTTMPSQLVAPIPAMILPEPEAMAPLKSELMAIHGINEKRAAQLKDVGISSIDALANASADDLAKGLSVSPRITRMWIGSAKKLKKNES
jgi:predicted flap endonuclease-1-like 5' DNA nuclease